jgi:beige protein homolog 1
MTDETERAAVLAQINNFGQTPLQLFKRPHPPRGRVAPFVAVFSNPDAAIASTAQEAGNAIGDVFLVGSKTVILEGKKVGGRGGALTGQAFLHPQAARYVAWDFLDGSLRVYATDTEKVPPLR